MSRIKIPDSEYKERLARAAKLAGEAGLDVLLVNSNEADFANVRYFSGFWPLFEMAGVAISPAGEAALLVGPESLEYGRDVGKLDRVFQLTEYREPADPSYPEVTPDTFRDVFKAIGAAGDKIRIGIGGYIITTMPIIEGLRSAYPDAEIVNANHIMVGLRSVKSENEIACLKEAFRITGLATEEVMRTLKPGMTELQAVGIAQRVIYENGAEYEGLPMYVFSEKSTRHAISRSSYRTIGSGDIVQLNLSARIDGYSPSIGMPVSMGKLEGLRREVVEFGLEAHHWTKDQLRAGVEASTIATAFKKRYDDRGFGDNYLYGPCHGLGMIEVEAPWMETDSHYNLAPNMVFQVDTFVSTPTFGIRWENGAVVEEGGSSFLSPRLETIHEL